MTFDITKLELSEEGILEVKDPKGDDLIGEGGKPVTITLHGSGSKEYVKAKHKLDNASQVKVIAMMNRKTVKNAAEDNKEQLSEFLAACTKSIAGIPLAPKDIYSNPKLSYITSQVETFLGDDANFMQS